MKIQRFSIPFGLGLVLGGLLLPMQLQPVQAQRVPDTDNGAGAFDPGEIIPGFATDGTGYTEQISPEEALPELTTLPVYVPTATNIIQQLSAGAYPPAVARGIGVGLQQSLANLFVLDTDNNVYIASAQAILDALVADGIPSRAAEAIIRAYSRVFEPLEDDEDSAFLGVNDLNALNEQSSLVACTEGCEVAQADPPGIEPQEVEEETKSPREINEELTFRITEAEYLVAAVDTFNEVVDELSSEQALNPPDSLLLMRSVLYDLVEATWVDGEPSSETEDVME